jgi:hypothetical protein
MNFLNYKTGLGRGLICGLGCTALWFVACYFFSKLPAPTDVSLSLAFQPWWKNWETGLVILITVAFVIGILAALRPNLSKRNNQLSKH